MRFFLIHNHNINKINSNMIHKGIKIKNNFKISMEIIIHNKITDIRLKIIENYK